MNINEKVTLFYKTYVPKTKDDSNGKELTRAFLDTGNLTSRISRSYATRIGYFETIKRFEYIKCPKYFETFTQAQEYIDEYSTNFSTDSGIIRLAKIIEDGKIVVRPVIIVKVKISGEIKDLEMIITDDTTHSIVLGRSDLEGYLIDTSKTFK